nr:MAG TPA: hypothetical protein [Caudoviricetes sp.]
MGLVIDTQAGPGCYFFAFPVPQAKKNGTSPGATGITSEDERSNRT